MSVEQNRERRRRRRWRWSRRTKRRSGMRGREGWKTIYWSLISRQNISNEQKKIGWDERGEEKLEGQGRT